MKNVLSALLVSAIAFAVPAVALAAEAKGPAPAPAPAKEEKKPEAKKTQKTEAPKESDAWKMRGH